MTKPRFTAGQHAALGESLARIRNMIQTEKIAIETAFPTTTGGQARKAALALAKALQQVDETRWAMENVMFEDIPGSTTHTYSGRADRDG